MITGAITGPRRLAVLGAIALGLIAIAGCGSTSSARCGTKATDRCTPRVGPNESVTVDMLQWRVLGAAKRERIGDVSAAPVAKANGVFVEVPVQVTNHKKESVALTTQVIRLEGNGQAYDPDTAATVAAVGPGEKLLFVETLASEVTLKSKAVFDVPTSVASGPLTMRFGESGLGSTRGYIALPKLE